MPPRGDAGKGKGREDSSKKDPSKSRREAANEESYSAGGSTKRSPGIREEKTSKKTHRKARKGQSLNDLEKSDRKCSPGFFRCFLAA